MTSQLEQGTVFIIEDDNDVRESLRGLFRSVGLGVQAFASVQEYLAGAEPDRPGCMVLDVRLPGRNGLDFHAELVRSGSHIPVVFISGHADVPMSVRAMKAGAVEFLTKPVRDQDLLDAVQSAVRRDLDRREKVRSSAKIRAKFDTLTPREREIMAQLVLGRRNKQIADEMRLSEATVKLHRAHVMQKMAAPSLADLIWMGDALGLPRPKPHT
ncbi:MAG TPA: response regulator transcription factor [Bradyrhizobium sp.]|nr:response regulator transcription factor [Bradyrhizobium sp.]